MKEKPSSCIKCPACHKGADFSLDGFDRGAELTCGFTGEIIDGFYEHPGSEKADKERASFCPL